jgi:hypothetical protein
MTKTLDAPEIYGHAIFCDDIRFEVEGKTTYVGTYSGTMIAQVPFPLLLPKFCMAVTFSQERKIFDPNLAIQIFLPGDPDGEASIKADIACPPEQSPLPEETGPVVTMRSNLAFANFLIKEPGLIRIRVLRGGVLHRVGTLRVLAAQSADSEAIISSNE